MSGPAERARFAGSRAARWSRESKVELSDPAVVKIIADAGFDWVVIGADLSGDSPETVRSFLDTAAGRDLVIILRPGLLDVDTSRFYLDLGAQCILSPL